MELQEDRKSQIILDLLKELMSEMKGEAGKKFKPAEAEIEISAEPVKEEDESPEDEAKEVEEDGDEEDYDGADLEDESDLDDVLDKAANSSPASKRLAKLAATNRKA